MPLLPSPNDVMDAFERQMDVPSWPFALYASPFEYVAVEEYVREWNSQFEGNHEHLLEALTYKGIPVHCEDFCL